MFLLGKHPKTRRATTTKKHLFAPCQKSCLVLSRGCGREWKHSHSDNQRKKSQLYIQNVNLNDFFLRDIHVLSSSGRWRQHEAVSAVKAAAAAVAIQLIYPSRRNKKNLLGKLCVFHWQVFFFFFFFFWEKKSEFIIVILRIPGTAKKKFEFEC